MLPELSEAQNPALFSKSDLAWAFCVNSHARPLSLRSIDIEAISAAEGIQNAGRANFRISEIDPTQEIRLPDGTVIRFYEEAEAVLLHLKRRGTPMVLRAVAEGKFKPFSFSGMQKIVQRMRKELELPTFFTLDACRHGGMTELEEAELTDGQGRALSAHRTKESYEGYAKRNLPRALSATRKRHAHVLANASETSVQNLTMDGVQNERAVNSESI